mmetsp:Transcript_5783/g.16226  ORF Transcript_5783/g.16226 Transcript_5783/m.16226 type:complete len:273 (-) Transcript_5783:569-1387(-)
MNTETRFVQSYSLFLRRVSVLAAPGAEGLDGLEDLHPHGVAADARGRRRRDDGHVLPVLVAGGLQRAPRAVHRRGELPLRVALVELREHEHVLGVRVPVGLAEDLHHLDVLADGPVAAVDEVQEEREPRAAVAALAGDELVGEGEPVLALGARDLGEAVAGEVHEVELEVRRDVLVHAEVVELLRLARRLARVGERAAAADHVDERGLAHVAAPDEGDLRQDVLGQRLHAHGALHEVHGAHEAALHHVLRLGAHAQDLLGLAHLGLLHVDTR